MRLQRVKAKKEHFHTNALKAQFKAESVILFYIIEQGTCPPASTLGVLIHFLALFTLQEENGLDGFH
jgi:hypothetical protein